MHVVTLNHAALIVEKGVWPCVAQPPRACCSTSPARERRRGRIDGWMTPLLPSPPAPAVSSLPDFPTLPPVPWRPARRTARLRRRKTTTRRERKAPSPPHGSPSTTSPWPPGTCVIPPTSPINQKSVKVSRSLTNCKACVAVYRTVRLCVKSKVPVQLSESFQAQLEAGGNLNGEFNGPKKIKMQGVFLWVLENEWMAFGESDSLALQPCPNRADCMVSASGPAARPTLGVISIAGARWHWSSGPGHWNAQWADSLRTSKHLWICKQSAPWPCLFDKQTDGYQYLSAHVTSAVKK